jgi:hypothetical protein
MSYYGLRILKYGIKSFLSIIFNCNVFEYNNNYFTQTLGIAMGCKCGPSVANLYLYNLERKWVALNRPLLYKRFIDDICLINKKDAINKQELNNQFDNLKLNIVTDKTVSFLDLNISIDTYKKRIKFWLYTKPTNTFQYLHINSNHPKHIFRNIPKSRFIQLRRICTDKIDFLYHSRDLIGQLLKRGYKFDFLYKIFKQINNLNRSDLIKYRDKPNLNDINSIRICMAYDHNYIDLKRDLKISFEELKNNFSWLSNLNLNFTNSILPNFKKLIIDNNGCIFNRLISTSKCLFPNCKVCKYVNKFSHIKLGKFNFPLKSKCNCNSTGIVYVIVCKKCDVFYIGETEFSANKRISQHLYDIERFAPYGTTGYAIKKVISYPNNSQRPKRLVKNKTFNICVFKHIKITEVSEHFNLKGHDKNLHFGFCIFDKNLKEKELRQSVETDLINIVNCFKKVINKKIPNFKFVKKLCYS